MSDDFKYKYKPKKYLYNGISFDSGLEFIFYLYHKQRKTNITRIEIGKSYNDGILYFDPIKNRRKLWFPDFKIITETDSVLYVEIKPSRSLKYPINVAKRSANPKVLWVTEKEIDLMKPLIKTNIHRYLVKEK